MKTTYETGLQGERSAESYLTSRGMICLERRYRTRQGEIDLVMEEGDTLVFVEVKTRKRGETGSGLMAVGPEKQRRIARAAMVYLMKTHRMNAAIRFDVVELSCGEILHIPNAFQPGGMFFR